MIASAILQQAYNDLYKQMRNYIWDYEAVVKIADLEVASYMAFPDIDNIRRAYDRLKSDTSRSDVWSDDKLLQKAFDSFEEKLDRADQIFYGLFAPEEVVHTKETPLDTPKLADKLLDNYNTGEESAEYENQEELSDEYTDENTEAE